jgi:hypothetical protein
MEEEPRKCLRRTVPRKDPSVESKKIVAKNSALMRGMCIPLYVTRSLERVVFETPRH